MGKILAVLSALCLLASQPVQAAPIDELQRLLNNAGFNAGPADGVWGRNTATALAGFAAHYGIVAGDTGGKPDDAAVAALITAAREKLDAAYASYPTKPLQRDYFVGVGSQQFLFNEWAPFPGLVNRDGRRERITLASYFAPVDEDVAAFQAAGVEVIRLQFGMAGPLFYEECSHLPQDADSSHFDACYSEAFAAAQVDRWAEQTQALSDFRENMIVQRYVDGVEFWNRAGFHVVVVPSDFYNGRGSNFDDTDAPGVDALFHTALMKDAAFQDYFPRFAGALLNELKQRGLTNVSMQTANEPRFCPNSEPSQAGLREWTAIEADVIDRIRRVAPRISIISSAICLEGVTYFGAGRPYSELARVMPIHADMDSISFSIHLYAPSTLMEGSGNVARYAPGTVIHYPYQQIHRSAALNDEARHSLEIYNRVKPDAAYWEDVFADIAAFAEEREAPVLVTEMNAANPSFGLPREDRVALERDLIALSRQYDVPMFRFAPTGYLGLSSCPYNRGVSDHRFDPALLNLIAYGNSVPGAEPAAPIEPLEVQCGATLTMETVEVEDKSHDADGTIDTIFKSVFYGPLGSITGDYDYHIQGTYSSLGGNMREMTFTLISPVLDDEIPAGLRACAGVAFPAWDGRNHLNFRVQAISRTLRTLGLECLLENTEGEVHTMVRLLGMNFKDVALGMVSTGSAEDLSSGNLRKWINDIADGSIVLDFSWLMRSVG